MDGAFVMIRLTPQITEDNSIGAYTSFLHCFARSYTCEKYTMGIEKLDKFGKETHTHIHLCFITDIDNKKDSFQKTFRNRFFKRFNYACSGNKMYSIKLAHDPDDEERFMRYSLKQQDKLKKYNYYGYTEEEAEKLRLLAHDEYNNQIKKNCETLDKFLDKSSFKGKCYLQLKENKINKEKDFIINFVKYYLEKNKVPPFSKLKDYWIDYQLQIGLITVELWYERFFNVD